jgi:hypothetical protein
MLSRKRARVRLRLRLVLKVVIGRRMKMVEDQRIERGC